MRLYHSGLASWIWTWCAQGNTRGDSPPALRPWEAWSSLMDLCGRFRPVGPPRSSCATSTVVVTVAASTRCALYGLTGPLDAEQSPPGPEI